MCCIEEVRWRKQDLGDGSCRKVLLATVDVKLHSLCRSR